MSCFQYDKDSKMKANHNPKLPSSPLPEVVSSVPSRRDGSQQPYHFPQTCPVCGSRLIRLEGEASHYCINQDCPARVVESMIHFASRDAMDIDSLGDKKIEQLHDFGFLNSIEDIYFLKEHRQELLEKRGYQQKSVDHMLETIEASKKQPLGVLLFGLGIRQVGKKAAMILAKIENAEHSTLGLPSWKTRKHISTTSSILSNSSK